MVWREATTREELAALPLTGLARSLGAEVEGWLDIVSSPLPETLRLTPGRWDEAWTAQQIEAMGGVAMPWISHHRAYTMPFPRGHAQGEAKSLLSLLHTTGRITRQEAASMLPVDVLPLTDSELLLDLCAAPGSKTTQAAERQASMTVVANEPVSGRVNTLVSNRGRVSLENVAIVQHDGRHFPRIPPPGFDTIVADLPCTGSATMRKNRDVWWDWRPSAGRDLHHLQVGIASRGAHLLRPGGLMVVSTCSLDPVENEAVIAEVLRRCPWMDVIDLPEGALNGLRLREGLTTWSLLDEAGAPLDDASALEDSVKPPEPEWHAAIRRTRRLHPEDNDTGGFFLALMQHRLDATPEGVARTLVGTDLDGTGYLREAAPRSRHDVDPATGDVKEELTAAHGLADGLAWWSRGKRIALSPESTKRRLWEPPTPDGRGGRHRGQAFHPLRVVHVGLPVFANNRGQWRIRQEGLATVRRLGRPASVPMPLEQAVRLLQGDALELDEVDPHLPSGASVFSVEHDGATMLLPAWVQAKITLMLDEQERNLLFFRINGTFPAEVVE